MKSTILNLGTVQTGNAPHSAGGKKKNTVQAKHPPKAGDNNAKKRSAYDINARENRPAPQMRRERKITNPYDPSLPQSSGGLMQGSSHAKRQGVQESLPARQKNKSQHRKKSNTSPRRRRKNRMLLSTIFVVIVLILGGILSVNVLFKISEFRIDGECTYTQDEITAAFGHAQGENIFSFSLKESQQQLLQRLPYLESVKVRRRLPGTVVIMVQPAAEAYCAYTGREYIVLSPSLKPLRIADAVPQGVPLLIGTDFTAQNSEYGIELAKADKFDTVLKVMQAIAASEITGIEKIDFTDELELNFMYGTRYKILLGTPSNVEYKLEWAKKLIFETLGENETGTIDVSRVAAESDAKAIFKAGTLQQEQTE